MFDRKTVGGGGAPGGWSAPLAWGSAVGEDACLPTQPHPGIPRRPPLLQTYRNGRERYRKVKTIESVCLTVFVCVCVYDRDRKGTTERQPSDLTAAGDTLRHTKHITSKCEKDFYTPKKRQREAAQWRKE